MVKCPGCKVTGGGVSTHGRCLLCGYQIFPSKTLEKRARERRLNDAIKIKKRATRKRGEEQEMEDEDE